MAATNELAEQLPAGAAQQQAGLPATAIDNTLGKILLYVFWQWSVASALDWSEILVAIPPTAPALLSMLIPQIAALLAGY